MGFSNQAKSNIRKTWILVTLFLVFVIGLGFQPDFPKSQYLNFCGDF
jgi:preprotein translocase subunit SecG